VCGARNLVPIAMAVKINVSQKNPQSNISEQISFLNSGVVTPLLCNLYD